MNLEETRERIEALGWHVIAQKKHPNGVQFDATNYKRLAKGNICQTDDDAMVSCYTRVLSFERMT